MAENDSFFGSVKDATDISNWCKEFGVVNNQPEIVRAGELIDILMDHICEDADLIGEYSNDADRLFDKLKKERKIFESIIEELQAAGLSRENLNVMTGLAKRNCDLRNQITVLRSTNEEIKEMLRLQEEEIKRLKAKVDGTWS